jgi:DNA-binding NarL/FixJ family response regulator
MPCVLLVEDSPVDADLIERKLGLAEVSLYNVTRVETLAGALMVLRNRNRLVDVVLLDLTLEDSAGIDTVAAVHREAPEVPIVVLSDHEDVATAVQCVTEGAQSFLVKTSLVSVQALEREILFTVERAKRLAYTRKVLRSTLRMHTRGASLLKQHVEILEHALEEIRSYLRRNSLVSYDAVEEILDRHGVREVLKELRVLTVQQEPGEHTALHFATMAIEEAQAVVGIVNQGFLEARNHYNRLLYLWIVLVLILGMALWWNAGGWL